MVVGSTSKFGACAFFHHVVLLQAYACSRLVSSVFSLLSKPNPPLSTNFLRNFRSGREVSFFQLALAVLAVLMGSSSVVRFTLASSPFLCPTLLRRTIQKVSCPTHNPGCACPICVSSLCGYRDPDSYLMLLCFSTREYFSRYTDALGSSAPHFAVQCLPIALL